MSAPMALRSCRMSDPRGPPAVPAAAWHPASPRELTAARTTFVERGGSSSTLMSRPSKGPIVQSGGMRYAVAVSSEWVDPEGVRRPGGEVHAWAPGTNQTLCGLALSRSRLERYPHVDWDDIRPESGRHADAVRRVCPRCMAGARPRRDAPQRRGRSARGHVGVE